MRFACWVKKLHAVFSFLSFSRDQDTDLKSSFLRQMEHCFFPLTPPPVNNCLRPLSFLTFKSRLSSCRRWCWCCCYGGCLTFCWTCIFNQFWISPLCIQCGTKNCQNFEINKAFSTFCFVLKLCITHTLNNPMSVLNIFFQGATFLFFGQVTFMVDWKFQNA